jgi:hypothetical protein
MAGIFFLARRQKEPPGLPEGFADMHNPVTVGTPAHLALVFMSSSFCIPLPPANHSISVIMSHHEVDLSQYLLKSPKRREKLRKIF